MKFNFDKKTNDFLKIITKNAQIQKIRVFFVGGIVRDKLLNLEENLKVIQYHDKIKNDYCKKNNIPLIRIPYWEKNNLEEFLFDSLVKYKAIELVD